jgi:putative phosphoribosyl transferase
VTDRFADRAEAGRLLGARLAESAAWRHPVVLALPRGGVPIAAEVAQALDAPMDVFVVGKLGVPSQPELAFGAVAGGGVRVLNPDVIAAARLGRVEIDRLTAAVAAEVYRRERAYRGAAAPPALRGSTAILVDDGIATGASMRAAIQAARVHGPREVVVAAPVAPAQVVTELAEIADRVVVLVAAPRFSSVGWFYDDFSQLSDADVREAMRARR